MDGKEEQIAGNQGDVTNLLRAWSEGDQSALEKITTIVYGELRRLASRHMKRERAGHSLQTTALVNEAYMRLIDYKRMRWEDRSHFMAVSAQVMRRILVESARRRNLKRGGDLQRVPFDPNMLIYRDEHKSVEFDLEALDAALDALARLDLRKAKVVELRFFGGLSVEETAKVLNISAITTKRDWRVARYWLYRELTGAPHNGPRPLEAN